MPDRDALMLTPEDEGTLAELLAAHTRFDFHGALGLLSAVVTAPARISYAEWSAVLDAHGLAPAAQAELQRLLCVACRLADVETSRRRPFLPPAHDAEACASFARGYLAGLELWPPSIARLDRLRCAAWACALGDRLDLLPPAERFRPSEEGRAALRREIGRFLLLTLDLWREAA